jgi:hypothetical protein
MKKGFLTKTVGGRKIEHIPCPHPGQPVDLDAPAVAVMHTIEGQGQEAMPAWAWRKASAFTAARRGPHKP